MKLWERLIPLAVVLAPDAHVFALLNFIYRWV
jgi:hypothetical protein